MKFLDAVRAGEVVRANNFTSSKEGWWCNWAFVCRLYDPSGVDG